MSRKSEGDKGFFKNDTLYVMHVIVVI